MAMRAFLTARAPRRGTRVAARYSVRLDCLGREELEDEKAKLTLQPRGSFGTPPPPFEAWEVDEAAGLFHCPRFYGFQRFGLPEVDDRVDGAPIDLTFAGTLTPVQQRASEAIFGHAFAASHQGAIVSLPCGYGKTVWSCYAIARLGRKTCVLVHKTVLRDQWKAALERFCPGVKVGFLQGKVEQVEGCDVVIAMVLTLARRDLDALDAEFGCVFCDEAHHMAAPVMNQALRLRARYIVGLTATKERPDGLTPVLHWCLGAEGFRVERDSEAVRVSIALFEGATPEILTRQGQPLQAAMVTALARHDGRNAFLADRVAAMRRAGRVVMVLSDRVAQLHTLRTMLLSRGLAEDEVGLFQGATKEADRPVQLARPVVLCSYQMANEGLDKVELDTCVMATPKSRVTQAIGRIQRPCPHKMEPLVLDVADTVSIFVPLRYKRQRLYRQERYEVQIRPALAADGASGAAPAWFE